MSRLGSEANTKNTYTPHWLIQNTVFCRCPGKITAISFGGYPRSDPHLADHKQAGKAHRGPTGNLPLARAWKAAPGLGQRPTPGESADFEVCSFKPSDGPYPGFVKGHCRSSLGHGGRKPPNDCGDAGTAAPSRAAVGACSCRLCWSAFKSTPKPVWPEAPAPALRSRPRPLQRAL